MTTTATLTWNPAVLDRKESINRKTAAVTTAAVFMLLLLSLLWLGMYSQSPKPEPDGFSLALGFSTQGSGEDAATPQTNVSPAASINAPSILTQSVEDAPVVNTSNSTVASTNPTVVSQPTVVNGSQFSGFNSSTAVTSGHGNNDNPGLAGDVTGPNLTDNGLNGDSELLGRSALHKERPATQKDVYGKVRVKITVNSQGKVINAIYSSNGSTTADSYLKQISIEAAMKWEWSTDPKHRPEQIGFIDFKYTAQ